MVQDPKGRRGTLEVCGTWKMGLVMNPDLSLKSWPEHLYELRKGFSARYTIPQVLADDWTMVMQEASQWFHNPDFKLMPAWEHIDTLPDSEVESRIKGFQEGYDKEYDRRVMVDDWTGFGLDEWPYDFPQERYDFESMPLAQKRAIVSRWDALHYGWLAETGVKYDPDIGYYWDIEGFKVKNVSTDKGQCPTEADVPGRFQPGSPAALVSEAWGVPAPFEEDPFF